MQYRRAKISGGTYFFTVVTYNRREILCIPANVDLLREVFRKVLIKHPFKIDAMVVLPDHLHCIWTLPPGDSDFSMRWRLIKNYFSRKCVGRVEKQNQQNVGWVEPAKPNKIIMPQNVGWVELAKPNNHIGSVQKQNQAQFTTPSRLKKKEQPVWQRRFWEHFIRDDQDFISHVEYIHYNPVRHGLVTAPRDWKYSSFHRYVREGMYDPEWGAGIKMEFESTVGGE